MAVSQADIILDGGLDPMTSDAEMRQIYEDWNDSVRGRDVGRLAALYSWGATFQSPAVLLLGDQFDGEIQGREEIASFFNAFFERLDIGIADWLRTGDLFVHGCLMTWEQAVDLHRRGPSRAVETVEAVEVRDGLIEHHRVYWNWAGMKALRSELPTERSIRRNAPLVLMKANP